MKPVLGRGGPYHRADNPSHLVPILSERTGQVKLDLEAASGATSAIDREARFKARVVYPTPQSDS